MRKVLEERERKGTLRRLLSAPSLVASDQTEVDFSSNDYLGLAQDREQVACVTSTLIAASETLGATGSRLLSGDSDAFHRLESYLAYVHHRPAALICNSGYDANLSVVSSLLCCCILHDEYIHNSLHMGIRLWKSSQQSGDAKISRSFRHNNVKDMDEQLQILSNSPSKARIIVLIESVYSMDGDIAPIRDMLAVCAKHQALLIVDEAHGLGVFGRERRSGALPGTGVVAMVNSEDHPSLLCSIHTFGKAAGCHGAVVCGSQLLKEYLVNYGYPFIYSTALPPHSLCTIQHAYDTMTGTKGDRLRKRLFHLLDAFRSSLIPFLQANCHSIHLLPSSTPIQALMISGNEECTRFCSTLFTMSSERIRLYPIKTPTVPAGQERIRIIIHAHNTIQEIDEMVSLVKVTLHEMGLTNSHAPPRMSRL